MNPGSFEIKSTDLAGRIGVFETKTSKFETPALLPVIHPVRQLVPCNEIREMGYEAVMTNAYTTFKRLFDRADEGIHKIIEFDGSVMTDSGGYQVLEFGSVETDSLTMANFEERIGTDIAIILDKPTGLRVSREHAQHTVSYTLNSARMTRDSIARKDIVWTLPIQGGRYLDLVKKSARESAKLDFGCYALGSPVEVMEEYDFTLLVDMIRASKGTLPENRPFHLFGAGHPLILPLAVALGCDMFDSASYILYARNDRYISSSGTIRLDQLEFLPCICRVCSTINASELRSMNKEERTMNLAKHNLFVLKQAIEETKQAIWEGRLWEYSKTKCSSHPLSLEAFKVAMTSEYPLIESGTPTFKDRGIFISEPTDLARYEVRRHYQKIRNIDLSRKERLIIVPETKTKPFLTSGIFAELLKLVDQNRTLICCRSSIFGIMPAEVSDIFPLSQFTSTVGHTPENEFILRSKRWKRIDLLEKPGSNALSSELRVMCKKSKTKLVISSTFKSLKRKLSSID